MDSSDKIFKLFQDLEPEARRLLLSRLYKETEVLHLDGQHAKDCPHCQSTCISKYGKHQGSQRFRCSACSRTFKETTGTALDHIHKKSLFLKFQYSMINEGYCSITEMASKFSISIPTAFKWRHRVLIALPAMDDKFEGEAQIDDLWVRYSQKGRKGLKYSKKRGGTSHKGDSNYQVKILTTTNSTQTEMKVTNIGRLSKADIQRTMSNKFSKKTVLISDKHPSISAFAKSNNITHHNFKATNHINDQGKGVQLLNNIASRVDTMINRTFKGVSTKYLQLYVNWFKLKENNKAKLDQIDIQKETLSKKYTWDLFSNIEKVYENFILTHSVRTYRCPQTIKFKAQNWNQQVVNRYAFI